MTRLNLMQSTYRLFALGGVRGVVTWGAVTAVGCGTDTTAQSERAATSEMAGDSTRSGATGNNGTLTATSSSHATMSVATASDGSSSIIASDTHEMLSNSTGAHVTISTSTLTSAGETTATSPEAATHGDTSTTNDGKDSSSADVTWASSESAATGGEGTSTAPLVALTVFLAGDSTVSEYANTASETDQAGWGQMLHEYLDPLAQVDNRAIGGRTARRFIDDGALAAISDDLKPGDVLMVQFGTNDGNRTATYELNGEEIPYYLEPDTDFKMYLGLYIDAAVARDSTPIFVTPPPRNSAYCTGGNGTGAHAEAMRALGRERGVAVVDLNARSVEYLKAICPAPTPEDFFLLRPDGTVDGTHFQENGARLLAGFVASELVLTETSLTDYVVER